MATTTFSSTTSNDSDSKLTQSKYKAFLGTIALCIIYAVVALLILLFGALTETGNRVMFHDYRVFTQTYIVGTLLIIILIALYVYNWNGKAATTTASNKGIIDAMACPDYWKMEKLSPAEIQNLRNSLNNSANLMTTTDIVNGVSQVRSSDFTKNYYEKNVTDGVLYNVCKMDPLVFYTPKHEYNIKNNTIKGLLDETNNNQFVDKDLRNNMFIMSADYKEGTPLVQQSTDSSGNVQYSTDLKCNQVFPELLSKLDAEDLANNDYKGAGNKYRCEYAKSCGIPWTDAGCSTY